MCLLGKGRLHLGKLPKPRTFASCQSNYDHVLVEQKWQKIWATRPDSQPSSKPPAPKFYALAMFPYPSGSLHLGHVRVYTIADCIARFKKLRGFDVLQPMGWDAFGLPAENAAIERGIAPSMWTEQNIAHMRNQLKAMALDIDWKREIATCTPTYFKWTQWIFLKMFERGLAYRADAMVNWDPVDQTVLANEQVDSNGRSWRSGAVVEHKKLKQWYLRITDYAEELLDGLEALEWPQSVKDMQSHWIGRSEGMKLRFGVAEYPGESIEIYTTRADTLFAATFIAISPEHALIRRLSGDLQCHARQMASGCRDRSTQQGVFTGLYAIHPVTKQHLPVWLASYVMESVGTSAIMGVPAHSKIDWNFADKYSLPRPFAIVPEDGNTAAAFTGQGKLVSGPDDWHGLSSVEARARLANLATASGFGGAHVKYRLRDWLISRQRYWGAPVPIIHCPVCKEVPVPEKELPVELPAAAQVDGRGSCLAKNEDWILTKCPRCSGPARRETDTMDTFVDSSWYFMRYIDPHNNEEIFSPALVKAHMPVDVYVGGIEHAILHLLYARFITRFLASLFPEHDLPKEPFKHLITQGMVQGRTFRCPDTGRFLRPDEIAAHEPGLSADTIPRVKASGKAVSASWEKMSKSKHNGVDPQSVIERYGVDALRLNILFKAPPDFVLYWDDRDIAGQQRWLKRLWKLAVSCADARLHDAIDPKELAMLNHVRNDTIAKVAAALDESNHRFNTAIACLMTFSNALERVSAKSRGAAEFRAAVADLAIMLAPFAPHAAAEIFAHIAKSAAGGAAPNVFENSWPVASAAATKPTTYAIQINGRLAGTVDVSGDSPADKIEEIAKQAVEGKLGNAPIKRVIHVKGKVVNFSV